MTSRSGSPVAKREASAAKGGVSAHRARHGLQGNVVQSGMATKRNRPSLTVTIDPDVNDRVRALVSKLPGATLAGVMDELLEAALPLYEDMADALVRAKRPDGSMDEDQARELVGAAIGARILRATGIGVQDTLPPTTKGGEDEL
jgi:hypothetical protein